MEVSRGFRALLAGVAVGSLGLAAPAAAQGVFTVRGVVQDSAGGPLAQVDVLVEGTTRLMRTGADGEFVLTEVPAGAVRVLARKFGYTPVRRDLLGVAGAVVRIELVLRTTSERLAPITVSARRDASDSRLRGFRERAEKQESGHFVTRERIEQSGNRNLLDALRGVPGVRIGAEGRMGRVVRLRFAKCPPLVFVDGFPAAAAEFDLESIDLHMVEGIEIYPSSASLPHEFFGPRGLEQCGVIAIWSRPTQARVARDRSPTKAADTVAAQTARAEAFVATDVDEMAYMLGGDPGIVYPDSLWRSRTAGAATIEFVVTREGRVDWRTLQVLSATHPAFAQTIVQALEGVRWRPALREGRPVAQLVVLPVEFAPPGPRALPESRVR